MRGARSFILLLVIAAALGWYAYRDSKKEISTGERHDKVFDVQADQIDEISIKSESGDRTTLRKTGSDWQIVQPAPAQPDNAEVSGLTSNLASLEVQKVVDDNPADVKEYGLAEPRVAVDFKAGGRQQRLLIGNKTPPGTDLYAKLGDQKRVFLISSYLDSTFNRGTFDLRDKTVLKLDRDKIDSFEVTTPQHALKVAKQNGEWQLAAPVQARADFSAVEGLVGRLATLQMKSIAADNAADLKQYGLDKPAATVRLGSGSSQATLEVGSSSGEGAVYARDRSRPAVFTIESSLLDDLKKDAGEYRLKDLFDARSFNATRMEIVRNGQTFAFEKTKAKGKDGQDEEQWRQTSPTARDVDQGKVENLASTITGARATGFVDTTAKTGLDKPELTVAIKYEEGKKEDRVTFARSGADAYAARAGGPGAARIDTETLDSIVKALEDLK
ncbi:MAG TPA: DUF4340 domain-containing protein [Solirubrobacterales bacterium]|nr:DUF4340 domain-containing protein [Solirubrobacterales bacterium]